MDSYSLNTFFHRPPHHVPTAPSLNVSWIGGSGGVAAAAAVWVPSMAVLIVLLLNSRIIDSEPRKDVGDVVRGRANE